ncbi:MAG: NAD(P)H-dependent oxidoreductase [Phycisphaerales bacterium]|jgi:multimeric flavodoxin WrbA
MDQKLIDRAPATYDDLRAVFVNCTLKKSPSTSHTQGLMDKSIRLMQKACVSVESIRLVDHEVPPGVQPDMTKDGYDADEWPAIHEKIMEANILVVGTPIWLGEKSSVCTKLIERLYSNSGDLNDHGQSDFYGRVGGCVITGNEDGVKHCSMSVLYGLSHVGFTIPPQADAGWIGEAGPGPSYLDEESNSEDNDFTNRNLTIMTWNLIHFARLLKDAGGVPAFGNQRDKWKDGERFGFEK